MSASIGHITIIKKNGKDGPIFLLEPTKRHTYTIGSADTNHIRMALPHVLPLHASITIDEDSGVYISSGGGSEGGGVWINDEVMGEGRRLLADSDVFRIAGRLFRVELGGESERDKENDRPAAALSTPTKALSSRENVPLAIISASPSSTTTTATPTRKPRVSAERDTGNTGSTSGGQHSSHTSTPTPNRKSTASRASTSPAANNTQRKSKGGGGKSPAQASDRKSNGMAGARQESGPSTPASKPKKPRTSTPASPANAVPAASASTPTPPLPSPALTTVDEAVEESDKPTDVANDTANAVIVEAEATVAVETAVVEHTSPQSIRDISSTDPASSAYDDMPPFELPYTNGPLTTLLEDPEEEEDPPRPTTRRFLPTPVRKEVETMAASLASKLKQSQPLDVTVFAAEVDLEQPARVSVGDGDVCHVDEEIMLSPGTLHRRALQLRHIRYGHVIRELKRKLNGGDDTEEAAEQTERDSAETVRIIENTTTQIVVEEVPSETEVAVLQQEEDMELEELLPSSAEAVALTISDEIVTTTIATTGLSLPPHISTQSVPASLPSPLKRAIRSGRQLRSAAAQQQDERTVTVVDMAVDSAFLPVAEILAHESMPSTRHSLPIDGAKGKRAKAVKGRASAAAVVSAAEPPAGAEEAVMEAEKASAGATAEAVADEAKETEVAAVDETTVLPTVTTHISDGTALASRKSLPARTAGKRQAPRRATAAPAAPDTDEADPASPPASLTTPLSAVPSTPSTPSKPAAASHAHTQQPTPKPLPVLPSPLRRSIRERGAKEQRNVAPLLTMPTPLRKEIREGRTLSTRPQEKDDKDGERGAERFENKEDDEVEVKIQDSMASVPEFVIHAVNSRHSLPPSVYGGEKRTRGQKNRRGTAAAKLAEQSEVAAVAPAEDKDQQPTNEPLHPAETGEEAPPAAQFMPSTSRPSTRRSLPAVNTGTRYTRGGRRATHAAFSLVGDETASPSSPPADATIAMDGVPPTPASPHKSSAKRQSLRSHLPTADEQTEEASVEVATVAFAPMDRLVASRQSVPAGNQQVESKAKRRQSAAPHVQQPTSDDMEVDEVESTDKQSSQTAETASEPIDFHTVAPRTRHSLPAATDRPSSSINRRQTAGPAFQLEDAPVTSLVPVLPSPVRRSIEQRLPRQAATIRQPLTSPLARDLRRGKVLRPASTQPESDESLMNDGMEAAPSKVDSADSCTEAKEEKEAAVEAETVNPQPEEQLTEQPKKRGVRKRRVDTGAPLAQEQQSEAAQPMPTRTKRRRAANIVDPGIEPAALPAAGAPTLTSILSAAGSRTMKGKKTVQIVDDQPMAELVDAVDEQKVEEEAGTVAAATKGRKGRQGRTRSQPEQEPVAMNDEEEKPVRKARRPAQVEENKVADAAEQSAPTAEHVAPDSNSELQVAPRSRRGWKGAAVAAGTVTEALVAQSTRRPRRGVTEPEQPEEQKEEEQTTADVDSQAELQPARRRAGRSKAATTELQPAQGTEAAVTRKSRRKQDSATEDAPTAAPDDVPAAAGTSSSSTRSRTRKATKTDAAVRPAAEAAATLPPVENNLETTVVAAARQARGRRGATTATSQPIEEKATEQADSEAATTVNTSRTRKGRTVQRTAAADEGREPEEKKDEAETEVVAEQPARRGRRLAPATVAQPEAADNTPTNKRPSRRRAADELSEPVEEPTKPAKRSRRTNAAADQVDSEPSESAMGSARVTRARAGRR